MVIAERMAFAIRSPTVPNRIDRNTAVPAVPPICRKNVAAEVATPMSCGRTSLVAASTSVCIEAPRPRPRPITKAITMTKASEVSTVIVDSPNSAAAIRPIPATANIL